MPSTEKSGGGKPPNLAPVVAIKLSSVKDLVRMASSVAMTMQSTYIIRFRRNGRTVLGFLAVFRDYYNYYGVPMFYYAFDDDGAFSEASYVLVKLDERGERIEPSASSKPGYVTIPIINIEKLPPFLETVDLD
ncbi:MAG: cren protein [Crenarchaeota archaeon]|nr:cren protein [Thermoproteota archaeon]